MVSALLAAVPHLALADVNPTDAAPAERTIMIEAYDVESNTLLDQVAVEEAVYPFLGPDRGLKDVEGARSALEKAYHARGYQSVVVEVPQQSGANGIIRLKVVEAPVGRLRVTGTRYFSPEVMRRQAPSLAEGATPNLTDVQRDVADLNRLSDRQVTPLLKPGKQPGKIDVELKVDDKLPLHASLELNNNHSADTTSLRTQGSLRYTNLWQMGHTISATYLVAPDRRRDSEVISGSYMAPLWGTPWTLMAFAYKSNSDVATLSAGNVLGKGHSIGLRAIMQLPNWGMVSHSLNFGVDYKDFAEKISIAGQSVDTPLVYWPFSLVYSLQSFGEKNSLNVQTGVTMAVRGLGSNEEAFYNKRAFARPNFVRLNLDAEFTRNLGSDTLAALKISGQLADQPLASAEQFSAGGASSVRGYLASEVVGDNGVFASLELRTPSFGERILPVIDEWRLIAFADFGYAHVLRALSEQEADFSIASLGVGQTLRIFRHMSGDISVGFPLKNGPTTKKADPYATFSVKTEF